MSVPKIKRDITNTKITNKDEIINYIKYYMEDDSLLKYKEALYNQTKIDYEEVKTIVNTIDFRRYLSSELEYKKEKVEQIYNINFDYIKKSFRELYKTNDIAFSLEKILIDFLDYCVTNEENGIQNNLKFKDVLNEFKYRFDSKEYVPRIHFYNEEKNIIDRINALINKTDSAANDYKEKETNENNNYGGFILTSIIIESSIIIAFLLSLFALLK